MSDPDQFSAALTRIGAVPPTEVIRQIVAELDRFAAGQEPEDDQTLVVAGID